MIRRRVVFGLVANSLLSFRTGMADDSLHFEADPEATDHQDAFERTLDLAKSSGLPIRVTGTIRQIRPFDLHEGAVLLGNSPRLYPEWNKTWLVERPAWPKAYSVIQYVKGRHGPTFSGGRRARIENLIVRRCDKPSPVDSVFPKGQAPSHLYWRNCLFQFMDAICSDPGRPWGAWQFEDNTVMGCGYGFTGIVVDMKISGNTFVSMRNAVLQVESGGGFNLIALNRMEWGNLSYVSLRKGCRTNTFSNNIFDACGSAAVDLSGASRGQIFDSNIFWRNGRTVEDVSRSSHIFVKNSGGHQFSNNRFVHGTPDQGGAKTPKSVFRFEDCSGDPTVVDRIGSDGCASLIPIQAVGSTVEAVELPSLELQKAENQSNSEFSNSVLMLNRALSGDCELKISGVMPVNGDLGYCDRISLRGNGEANLVLNGNKVGFSRISNVTIGKVAYLHKAGRQMADRLPSPDGSDGLWLAGQMIVVKSENEEREKLWICNASIPVMQWTEIVSHNP